MSLKKVYSKSRWLHKIIGLILIPFLIWMSISGIILNHPEVFADIDVPAWLVPGHYHNQNWNRSSLIGAVHWKETTFVYGKKGVWREQNGHLEYFGNGLPESAYYQKTNHLLLVSALTDTFLFAATDGGLFYCTLPQNVWRKVALPAPEQKLKKLLKIGKQLIVVGESDLFKADLETSFLKFSKVTPKRKEPLKTVTMVQLFFDVHDGKAWGMHGKLFMDLMGLIIIFASVTGFYVWFRPWSKRKQAFTSFKPQTIFRLRKWNKWHIKVGAWVVVFFIVLAATGLFMRPPFIAAIAEKQVDRQFYPGKLSENPWERKIHNALFDFKQHRIILATSEGLWSGAADFSQPFQKITLNVPIFVMGPTYFECLNNGHYRVASFSGIFDYDPQTDRAVNLITGEPAGRISTVRPAELMVTGYFELTDSRAILATHEQGLCDMSGKPIELWPVPEHYAHMNALSLWNFMFEVHNGRIFKSLIGGLYILIIPLGSILFLLISFTGLFDWAFRKFRKPHPIFLPLPVRQNLKHFTRLRKTAEV